MIEGRTKKSTANHPQYVRYMGIAIMKFKRFTFRSAENFARRTAVANVALATLLLIASGSTEGHASPCDPSRAVWSADYKGNRFVLYGSNGIGYSSDVVLEKWDGKKIVWRSHGTYVCSMGVVICRVFFETDSGRKAEAIVEKAGKAGGSSKIPEWVVLAGLQQATYYQRGLSVTYLNGELPDQDSKEFFPNAFSYHGCRKKSAVDIMANKTYALTSICRKKLETGKLEPDWEVNETWNGAWWVRGTRIVGHEFECEIMDFIDKKHINAVCGMGDIDPFTPVVGKFEMFDNYVIINGKEKLA